MKKTRILAALLSLMMVVCAFPVMQASAAEVPADLGKAIAAVMNTNDGTTYASAVPSQDTADWYAMNEDFTQCSLDSLDTEKFTHFNDGITFNSTDGLVFPDDTKLEFVLSPWAKNPGGHASWSPWTVSNYFGFTFQLKEGGVIDWRAGVQWKNYQAKLVIEPTGITVYGGTTITGNDSDVSESQEKLVDYQPGTGVNNALLYKNGDGYDLYMKQEADPAFTKVASVAIFASGGNVKRGNNVYGQKASIRNAITFAGTYLDPKDSIDEVLGGPAGSTYALDFDANSSFAKTEGRDGFCDGAVWNNPDITSDLSKYEFDADGLTLIEEYKAESGEKWIAWGAYGFWSSLNALNPSTGAYSKQALYVKAKGDFNLRTKGPKNGTRFGIKVAVGSDVANESAQSMENIQSVIIQDEWTEYLMVPDESAPGVPANTVTLYVKGATATGGKWWNTKKLTYAERSDSYVNTGLAFNNVTGHIKSIRTMAIADSISNTDATPAGANCLYFNADNYDVGGIVENIAVPDGGYAEFKVQYDGIAHYRIYDGVNRVNVTQQSDYGSITTGNNFTANNNTSWRTWRFVKNNDGSYNIYSKTEGDTGWFVHGTNAVDANAGAAKIEIAFGAANDGTTTKSEVDYLKVYGPASENVLTMIDGETASLVKEGVPLSQPESLRISVPQDAGKLLVVSYKNNDTIDKVDVFDVKEDFDGGSILINLNDSYGDDTSKVRFFFWNDFDNIKNLAHVVPTYSVINNSIQYN